MVLTLTDWKPKHGSPVKFSHPAYPGAIFNGVIRSSTMGKVLIEMPDNEEKFVWFFKNEIELL